MWAVFKINIKELNLFKEDIIKKLNSDVTFYAPKVIFKIFHKNKEKKRNSISWAITYSALTRNLKMKKFLIQLNLPKV